MTKSQDTITLLNGLRFIDSFFPSGGFAFSSGLEAAVQMGAVCDGDDLARYVNDLFLHGIGRCEAVAVALAHEAAVANSLDAALQIDRDLNSMKLCRETRAASRQMGRQILRSAGEQVSRSALLPEFFKYVDRGLTAGHLATSMGLVLSGVGWGKQAAVAGFLYHVAVGYVSASIKLLPIGQQEGQRLLHDWLPLIDKVSLQASDQASMASWSPAQDIYTMRHAHLSTRLFRS